MEGLGFRVWVEGIHEKAKPDPLLSNVCYMIVIEVQAGNSHLTYSCDVS